MSPLALKLLDLVQNKLLMFLKLNSIDSIFEKGNVLDFGDT